MTADAQPPPSDATPRAPSGPTDGSYLAPVWTHLTDLRVVRGEGPWLFDADGERWLDFTSGIGVTNTGHAHPRVVAAIREQAQKLLFAQVNIVQSEPTHALARRLVGLLPPALDRVFFSNSGAEAVEGAVKLVRHATGRTNVIVFQGSFHGRTHQAMAMTTAKPAYRHRYPNLPSGVIVAPFPYARQLGMDEDDAVEHCLRQLELILATQSAPDETAGIAIEPVLGEGGYVVAPDRFLRGLEAICRRHDIPLILDEVQSGFGRTGRFFAFEHAGIEPDVVVMAKGLGSGMPISAIAASSERMARWEPGTHGGTYGGGNAVVMAAALATIDVLEDEGLVANAAGQGERLLAGIRELAERDGRLAEVRGRGLMIATEFHEPADAKAVQAACLERRMLILTCGPTSNALRWIPPLIVDDATVDRALEIFSDALRATRREETNA